MIKEESIKDLTSGKVEAVLLGLESNHFVTTRVDKALAQIGGFKGDRHSGLTKPADSRTSFYEPGTQIYNDRQVTIVSMEELAQVAARLDLPEIKAEWMGANLLISGLKDLSRISPASRLFFEGGAVLYVTKYNNPCSTVGRSVQDFYPERTDLASHFPKAAWHLRGIVAVVDVPGEIGAGEVVRVKHETRYVYQE